VTNPSWGDRGPQTQEEYDDEPAQPARICPCCGSEDWKHPERRCERCGGDTFRLIPTRNGDLAECKGCGLVAVA
jgi:hypothetical protein